MITHCAHKPSVEHRVIFFFAAFLVSKDVVSNLKLLHGRKGGLPRIIWEIDYRLGCLRDNK